MKKGRKKLRERGKGEGVCVCQCVMCIQGLQLWNVESARGAQWHVWNQSEKESLGTRRVRMGEKNILQKKNKAGWGRKGNKWRSSRRRHGYW